MLGLNGFVNVSRSSICEPDWSKVQESVNFKAFLFVEPRWQQSFGQLTLALRCLSRSSLSSSLAAAAAASSSLFARVGLKGWIKDKFFLRGVLRGFGVLHGFGVLRGILHGVLRHWRVTLAFYVGFLRWLFTLAFYVVVGVVVGAVVVVVRWLFKLAF